MSFLKAFRDHTKVVGQILKWLEDHCADVDVAIGILEECLSHLQAVKQATTRPTAPATDDEDTVLTLNK